MSSSPILLVLGTRPEAIKLAPLAHAFADRGLEPRLVLTGQHPQLDPAAFGLGSFAATKLRCRSGTDPLCHADMVAEQLRGLIARSQRPGMVVVQGDTSSALGGALGAKAASLPLAHVEAGLRSFDLALPWPEEGNRVAIDAVADLLFAATPGNAANLIAEGVGGEIHVTGNTAIDALFKLLEALPPRSLHSGGLPRLLVTCHRRENWAEAFAPIAAAIIELARSPFLRIEVVVHSNPAMADVARLLLGGHPRVRLLPPMNHRTMVAAMRSASIILSDSGGIQEEAPALGIPLLILRSKTERPEGVDSGNSRLIGSDRQRIVDEVRRLMDDGAAYRAMAVPALPFGDGQAAPRIAAHIDDWLVRRRELQESALA